MDNWIDLTNYGIAVAGLIAYVSFDLLSQFSLTMLGEPAAMLSRIAVFGESFFSSLLIVSVLMMLLNILGLWHRRPRLSKQQDRYVAQQEENARQKASIMVLEMRPHYKKV